MYPFIQIGSLTLSAYGLMVAAGLAVAFLLLYADFERRKINASAETIIAITALAGIVGARLYHLLETPREFFGNPWPLLVSTTGYAWFGALIGGFIAFVLLARHSRIKLLLLLDAASPAAAAGYGIGRIGCLLSGDGDYGRPTSLPWGMSFPHGVVPTTARVHPTPLYELAGAMVLAWVLWRIGSRAIASGRAAGSVFAWYLVLTGVARFLVEFIRINPRFFVGLTNAQSASILSLVSGVFLLRVFMRSPKEVSRLPEPAAGATQERP
jgi:phosphatidylglycerol:prolipoprotein diacylglycerol transferase